ncbi:MAG: SDR family oxidoreductase [Clostridiales Family XIII bacterium]|jgi:short-subunit dehydrogenase|nr:SDR family oxidoreductase [Clostridiales Family XIII bacterium]
MPTLLVVGATSDIARATAKVFALSGWDLILAARDTERLSTIAKDLKVRSLCDVACRHYDVTEESSREELWNSLDKKPDAILISIGFLGDQERAAIEPDLAYKITNINYSALIPLLIQAADFYEKQGSGSIIGISSVAGDRGRKSNYTYGAAKAAFSTYLSGLRNRLASKGVQVLTVKPGYVKTAMTQDMELSPFLTATPEEVGRRIFEAVKGKKDVIYVKWFWRWIMFIIKALPEFIFKRTKF